MDISEARQVLSVYGWLTKTPAPFREAVLLGCKLRRFKAGETVYAQGDRSASLWGLAEGSLAIEHSGGQRNPSFVFFATKGFWIGAQTLVLGPDRQVGLVATRPTWLLHLQSAAFDRIAQDMPEAWRWLAVLPLLQTSLAFGTLNDLMIRNTEARCAAILLRLAGCRGPIELAQPNEIFVTQEQLAEMLNLSRTAIGEVLREFEARGFIARQYGRLTIDRKLLEGVVNAA